MYGKTNQSLAPNSTGGHMDDMPYDASDGGKVKRQIAPNTRMNGYITNRYAGPGSNKGSVKVKGKSEHHKQEDEAGNDYGV